MDVVINLAPEDSSHMALGDGMLTAVSQQNCLKIIEALDLDQGDYYFLWATTKSLVIAFFPEKR